jgi:hypothetical protein
VAGIRPPLGASSATSIYIIIIAVLRVFYKEK